MWVLSQGFSDNIADNGDIQLTYFYDRNVGCKWFNE